jgi:hypothetical protein
MTFETGQDIKRLLDEWEFEPGQLQVRLITGDDGREKIQMRVELGVIQMELSGRPDATRPHGYESLLEFHEAQAAAAREGGTKVALDSEACALLLREGQQYYRRYRSAFQLQRYDIVERDTARNLRLFAFVRRHAAAERDKIAFDRYRPYVQMMFTRARAALHLDAGNHAAALETIDAGIKAIRRFLREYNQEEREHQCDELRFLLGWRREVARDQPAGALEKLKRRLQRSVVAEDYAEAARLRDLIRQLQVSDSGPPA